MDHAEGIGAPLRYRTPRTFMSFVMSIRKDVMPSDPASDWRYPGSGLGSVKWDTGHVDVGNQATHGNSDTGIHIWKTLNIGTWNVRGLNATGKLAIVEKEISNFLIVGLSETHWRGSGHFETRNRNIVFYSGSDDSSKNGVGIIMNKKFTHAVREYKAINDRLIIIPTTDATDEDVDAVYSQIEQLLATLPNREITMIMEDFNAKVGKDSGGQGAMGKFGLGVKNDRGERLLQFCIENNFHVSNTGFQHHPRRLYTWISPGGRHRNQIDYVIINSRWKTAVKNARTFPGKDCNSDHQFLAVLRIKMSTPKPVKPIKNLWCLKNSESLKAKAKEEITKLIQAQIHTILPTRYGTRQKRH